MNNSDIPLDLMLESASISTLADLEQHLRACLIKINTCKPRAKPRDISFTLSIEKNGDGYPVNGLDWIPAEISFNWKQIVPLKSVPMDLFRVSKSRRRKDTC